MKRKNMIEKSMKYLTIIHDITLSRSEWKRTLKNMFLVEENHYLVGMLKEERVLNSDFLSNC